ncbi:hypothetical protein [Hydrogenophaga aromaticivorans]|uniref:hypothetical protein n=1 Tax=Hydrogenophaga aromaticivorans TaxID=2610898 RepID=UPI001C4345E7|nr:hypothetical protein [Hydrogenophaga aromaticivorans]
MSRMPRPTFQARTSPLTINALVTDFGGVPHTAEERATRSTPDDLGFISNDHLVALS